MFVNVCDPVNVATVESIAISFELAVIPVPPTTFNVSEPLVPPPVKPAPATTSVTSPTVDVWNVKAPDPSVVNTCPEVPSDVGKEYALFTFTVPTVLIPVLVVVNLVAPP